MRPQFELEPKPQSGGDGLPILGAVGSSPHALPRSRSRDQAHMDPFTSRARGQGVMRRVPGLSFIIQYVNFQRGFFLQTATGFCTGQTKPKTSSYHMQIMKLKQMHLCKRSFHFG